MNFTRIEWTSRPVRYGKYEGAQLGSKTAIDLLHLSVLMLIPFLGYCTVWLWAMLSMLRRYILLQCLQCRLWSWGQHVPPKRRRQHKNRTIINIYAVLQRKINVPVLSSHGTINLVTFLAIWSYVDVNTCLSPFHHLDHAQGCNVSVKWGI
jgi:hypothetical protein